jgi:hypothetical protein
LARRATDNDYRVAGAQLGGVTQVESGEVGNTRFENLAVKLRIRVQRSTCDWINFNGSPDIGSCRDGSDAQSACPREEIDHRDTLR